MSGKGILIEPLGVMDKRIKILKLKKEIEKLEDELAGTREKNGAEDDLPKKRSFLHLREAE